MKMDIKFLVSDNFLRVLQKTKNQSIDQHTTGKSLQGSKWEEINIILKYCEQLSYFLLAAHSTPLHTTP